ncbi:hypothetical protein GQ53DRAFT_829908 [Thozetella sp. PMI_491]|nr:hypothetical protein GQ53DRAFT_829908 [Thozetella sp. PMI_491]
MTADESLHASVTRVRIALLQSQIRDKSDSAPAPAIQHRRRRSSSAVYAGSKDGVPFFTKQKTVRVVS